MLKSLPKILSGIAVNFTYYALHMHPCTFPVMLVLCSNLYNIVLVDDSTFRSPPIMLKILPKMLLGIPQKFS